ncbi:uncharacterized protein PADG_03629 [Paracoccidioides brasiliensis Pb18]|uniref:C2H2-type domain-containing protein n=1 Tax=Paracoccidioides brasiliensis (strain Pb18) TaxID=502780 RepID=C1G8P3_PARBD|nr:uncharacterized protein PADG_03629 [Paracoccidioides brasiliensis Pb18]EEH47545.1 hypothetical protein PADG_03629 [Paracoccidioides brasiliensis Pb18]
MTAPAVAGQNGGLSSDGTPDIAATHPFTCNTCQVAFRNSDAQRTHMRSDWHRYNLKRRVASLPPLSSEIFAEKVLTAQAVNFAAAAKASFEKSCAACQKTFFSENAFQNHMASQKHKSRETQLRKNGGFQDETASVMSGTFSLGEPVNATPTPSVQESAAEEEFSKLVDGVKYTSIESEDPLFKSPPRPTHSATAGACRNSSSGAPHEHDEDYALTHCMFCNRNSDCVKLNVFHMRKFHGMFVPEQAYLVDGEGLLKYLFNKITKNNECLYCHKIKSNTAAIQTHMRDKGHCMIAFSTEDEMLEVGQFYDFSSTYSDDEDDEEDEDVSTAVDAKEAGDDDGWETDSSTSTIDGGDALYHEYELHLPSGRTAGHRSLFKYFRQNLRNYPTPDERLLRQRAITDAAHNPDIHDKDASSRRNKALISRVNGGLGMVGATDSQKREVKAAELRERRREHKAQNQYEWGINKRGNHQKHFRDHLLQ